MNGISSITSHLNINIYLKKVYSDHNADFEKVLIRYEFTEDTIWANNVYKVSKPLRHISVSNAE